LSQSCSSGRGTTTYEEPTSTREPVNQDDYLTIFDEIVGYDDLKLEFAKALMSSSPVGILLVGPLGCGKSEFLRKINTVFPDHSLLIDEVMAAKPAYLKNYTTAGPIRVTGRDRQA
jgi:Mg-chelatase subunit ChlI